MNTLSGILSTATTVTKTGVVTQKISGTRYKVKIGSSIITAISSREIDLVVGTRVTVVKTSYGWTIVNGLDISGLNSTEKYINVAFDSESDSYSIRAELDSDMNEGVTTFGFTDPAYFKVFTFPEDIAIVHNLSDGVVTPYGSGTNTVTEIVTFDDTDSTTLSYPIGEIVAYTWKGNSLGNIVHVPGTEATIKAANSGVGVLSITYITSKFRRYLLNLGVRSGYEWTVLDVIKYSEDVTTTLTVNYEEEEEGEGEWTDYYLTVKDFCLDVELQGISLVFDGQSLPGQTDENGKIYVGRYRVGSSHTVSISDSKYRPFEAEFEIPAPEEDTDA